MTTTVPADTPAFLILRDAAGGAVSSWNGGCISIAQGSAWARPGETVPCVGCHLGHLSGSLDSVIGEALRGRTSVAPHAAITASSFCPDCYRPFMQAHGNERQGWGCIPAGAGRPISGSDDRPALAAKPVSGRMG